jgi:outer membrane biosynthesis protein TonB
MGNRTLSLVALFLLLLFFLTLFSKVGLLEVKGAKDKTPPTGSVIINYGDIYTNTTSVTLTLTADDPESSIKEVRYGNTLISGRYIWGRWEIFSETKLWTLTSGDGIKTVYYQIKNNDNLVSIIYSDTIILNTQPIPTPEPTPTTEPTPEPTPTTEPTPEPTPTTEPTPEPTPTTEPTPEPTPNTQQLETSTPKPKATPEPALASKDIVTPSPSAKSSFNPILTDSAKNEKGKPIVLSLVLVCGGTLLFWSLKRKK